MEAAIRQRKRLLLRLERMQRAGELFWTAYRFALKLARRRIGSEVWLQSANGYQCGGLASEVRTYARIYSEDLDDLEALAGACFSHPDTHLPSTQRPCSLHHNWYRTAEKQPQHHI